MTKRKSNKKKIKFKTSTIYIILGILIVLYYFIFLPPLNLQNIYFILYLSIILGYIISLILYLLKDKLIKCLKNKGKNTYKSAYIDSYGKVKKVDLEIEQIFTLKSLLPKCLGGLFSFALIFVIILAISGSSLFCAKLYAKQLTINEKTNEEFDINFTFEENNLLLPMIDKDIAFKYAQAKLSTYGAQYDIDIDNFTLLNVNRNGKNELVRITPLEYSGFFVALNRYNQGTIGYIEVNVVTKETKLIEVEGGMKYMPSSIFFKNLDFHIRMKYPSILYKDKFFEIDDEGNPYWVVPTYKNEIALFSGKMSEGVLLVNPINGDMTYYKIGEEPNWIDRVILDTIVEKQATNALRYKNGWLNATFGQKKMFFKYLMDITILLKMVILIM